MSFKIIFWYWWALAAVLLVFEMMLPGIVFLFLSIGALACRRLSCWSCRTCRSNCSSSCSRSSPSPRRSCCGPTLKRLQQGRPTDANLNARGDSLVGRTIVLDHADPGRPGPREAGRRQLDRHRSRHGRPAAGCAWPPSAAPNSGSSRRPRRHRRSVVVEVVAAQDVLARQDVAHADDRIAHFHVRAHPSRHRSPCREPPRRRG